MTKLEQSHSYLLGCCEGAIKGALIDLKYGHTETAVKILQGVLTQIERADEEMLAARKEREAANG